MYKAKYLPKDRKPVSTPPRVPTNNHDVLKSLRALGTNSHSIPLLPFPRPFPDVVLRRILHFLPWYHRIPLEGISKQFYRILRPQKCDLPPVSRTYLIVKREEVTKGRVSLVENSSIDLFPFKQSGESHLTVVLTFGHKMSPELVLDNLERILRQFPVTQIELSGIKEQAEELFNCIAFHTRHIRNLTTTQCLKEAAFGPDFWINFGKRMVKLKELIINEQANVDQMLSQLVSVCHLERIQVWGISDVSLVALCQNASKLHDFECRSASSLTTQGIVALTKALVQAPPLPGGQRRRVFLSHCCHAYEFWQYGAGLLNPIAWNQHNGQMVFLPKWNANVREFANDRVVVIFN